MKKLLSKIFGKKNSKPAEPVSNVTCKCNCGKKDCNCSEGCDCKTCGCECNSNCSCKAEVTKKVTKKVAKKPVSKPVKKPQINTKKKKK